MNQKGQVLAYRVVPSNRAVRGVHVGDPVVVVPVEDVLVDATLLALPTVRRVARAGLRGVVLVPLAEWEGAFPTGASVEPSPAK